MGIKEILSLGLLLPVGKQTKFTEVLKINK